MVLPIKRRRRYGKNLPSYSSTKGLFQNSLRNPENVVQIDFITWNVEKRGTAEDIDKDLTEAVKARSTVVCVQEASLPASGETTNYNWLCSGTFGSAVLVNKSSSLKVGGFEQVCEQICVAEVTANCDKKVKVISCYIPPATDYVSVDLWSKLTNILKSLPSNVFYILAGDFNAAIGKSDLTNEERGNFGEVLYHDVSNENGSQFRKLARKAYCKFVSTFPTKKTKNTSDIQRKGFTYKDGEEKSQRDLIIMPCLRGGWSEQNFNAWHLDHKHAMVGCLMKVINLEKITFESEPKESQDKIWVGTWNIQAATPAKVDQHLCEHNLPIVCVQELFITSDEEITTQNFTWYSSKKHWSKNVGVLVKKLDTITVSKFEAISEFVCVADVVYFDRPVKVISCYLPLRNDPHYEKVTAQVTELVKSIPEKTEFILAGDFNAKKSLINLTGEELASCEDNIVFLQNLANDANLSMEKSLFSKFPHSQAKLISHLSETERNSRHHFLVPRDMRNDSFTRMFVKWIPFFENGILCLEMEKKPSPNTQKDDLKPQPEAQMESDGTGWTSETIDGVIHRTKVVGCEEFDAWDKEDESLEEPAEPPPMSEEDLEKFQNTLPGVEDLRRILHNFVIYYKANCQSIVKHHPVQMLHTSFREGKYGRFLFEVTDVMDDTGKNIKSRKCRMRWNGILLCEETATADDSLMQLRSKCTFTFIARLSQVFYTLKDKKSYYNRGLPPVLADDPKIAKIYRVVKKMTHRTIKEVTKFMDNFFAENTDCELVFGVDFTRADLTSIKEYAKSKKLGFRFMKCSVERKVPSYIAVFRKQTPQSIRDKLIEHNMDYRHYLIAPCGVGVKFREFNQTYEGCFLKEENKLIQKFWNRGNIARKATGQKQNLRAPPARAVARNKPAVPVWQVPPQSIAPTRIQPALARHAAQAIGQRAMQRGRLNNQSYQRGQRTLDQDSPYNQSYERAGVKRRSSWDNQAQFDFQSDNSGYHDQWDNSRQSQDFQSSGYKEWWDDSRQSQDFEGPGYGQRSDSRQSFNYQAAGKGPAKRPKLEKEPRQLIRVQIPRWRDLEPLIIVWPINSRSQLEDRPKQVLEANFPTDIVKGPNDCVAVLVSLRLRNGSERQYCLSVKDKELAALRNTLHMLLRNSTIIKPNPSFLCEGSVPNFVRYKVPCQTYPRTYIILSKHETGTLTSNIVKDILETFKSSINEDLFFDKDNYSYNEKMMIMEMAPKLKLKARHFGDLPGVVDHYMCVYKMKPKEDILEEVLRMRGCHPKYIITSDRLPSDMRLNSF